MGKFNIGDKVRRTRHSMVSEKKYGRMGVVYTIASERTVGMGYLTECGIIACEANFELVGPLEEAKATLEAAGYIISPPLPKLTDKIAIWRFKFSRRDDYHVTTLSKHIPMSDKELIAIVDWTEGDGL